MIIGLSVSGLLLCAFICYYFLGLVYLYDGNFKDMINFTIGHSFLLILILIVAITVHPLALVFLLFTVVKIGYVIIEGIKRSFS